MLMNCKTKPENIETLLFNVMELDKKERELDGKLAEIAKEKNKMPTSCLLKDVTELCTKQEKLNTMYDETKKTQNLINRDKNRTVRELFKEIKIINVWIRLQDGRAVAKVHTIDRFGSQKLYVLVTKWRAHLPPVNMKLESTEKRWKECAFQGIPPSWWKDPETPVEERPTIFDVEWDE